MRRLTLLWVAVLVPAVAAAQVDLRAGEHCTVQVLNETIPVAADGRWELPNIPANGGLVRARLHCIRDGTRRSGQSGFFVIQPNKMNAIPLIPFSGPAVSPSRLSLSVETASLTSVAQTVTVAVTGHYRDGSAKLLVGAEQGVRYESTNPLVAAVDAAGQVTALASGAALIAVLHDGVAAALKIQVTIGADTDQDGLPDDYEAQVGLDPLDPLDALGDQDADNLTALQEFELGSDPFDNDSDDDGIKDGEEAQPGQDGFVTSPVLADTDGDWVPDPVEVAVQTDPSDAGSVDLAAAVTSLQVTPSALTLHYSPLLGEASFQLKVIGVTVLGTGIDLTAHPATSYVPDDITVASVGPPEGRVYAGKSGETTITVSAAGETAVVPVITRTIEPQALGYLALPCTPTAVRLTARRAFVTCPDLGLLEVDASAPASLTVLATHALGFEPYDLEVTGAAVTVVGGSDGQPRAARLNLAEWGVASPIAAVALPGSGVGAHIAQANGVAAVAIGAAIQLVDAETLASLGEIQASGPVTDVALQQTTLAVTVGQALSLYDVATPSAPTALGVATAPATLQGTAFGDGMVFAAMGNSGIAIFDRSPTGAPVFVTNTDPGWAKVRDVAVDGSLLFAADYFRVNSIPIIRVLEPLKPALVGVLEFSQWGDDNGVAIDVHKGRAALLALRGAAWRLFLGQYGMITDTAGLPPTCAISQPLSGAALFVGQQIQASVLALDDVLVDRITLSLDGELVTSYGAETGAVRVTMPLTPGPHVLGAEAVDLGGNVGVCPPALVSLKADPGTLVVGVVIDGEGLPVAGALVKAVDTGLEVTTEADGFFVLGGVPAANPIRLEVAAEVNAYALLDYFGPFAPVPAGTTDVGELPLKSFVGDFMLAFLVAQPAHFSTDLFDQAGGAPAIGPVVAARASFVTDLFDLLAPPAGVAAILGPLVAQPAAFKTDRFDLLLPAPGTAAPLGPLVAQTAAFKTDQFDLLLPSAGVAAPLGPLVAQAAAFKTDQFDLLLPASGTAAPLGPLVAQTAAFKTDLLDLGAGSTPLGSLVARAAHFVTRPTVDFIDPDMVSLAAGSVALRIGGLGLADPTAIELLTIGGQPVDAAFANIAYDPGTGEVTATLIFGPSIQAGTVLLVITAAGGQSPDVDTTTNLLEITP